MKSHEALRRGRRSADWLTLRAIRRSAGTSKDPVQGEAGGGPGSEFTAGHRRPGNHAPEGRSAGGGSRPPIWGRRFSLRDWRVRSRLLLLIAVPVLVAVAFGGLAVVSSLRTAQSYQQVQRLAVLAGDATNLAQALQTEREDTVTFIAMGNQGGRANALSGDKAAAADELTLLQSDYAATSRAAAQVSSLAQTIGSSYPALAQTQAQSALTAIGDLPALRQAATTTRLPVLTVINDYGSIITQLLSLEDEVSAGSKSAALASDVLVTSLISSMKEEASQQQAIVTSALRPDQLGDTQISAESLSVLNQDASEQAANLSTFDLTATAAQRQLYNSELSSALAATAQQELQQASSLLASGITSANDPTFVVAAGNASYITSALGSVEQQLMSSIIAQSGSLRDSATETALIEGVGVLLLLVLALVLIALVGQSMIGPLRRLRAGALEIAGVRLPETVRLMAETDGEGVSLQVEPIDIDSADEIGEVARAFDQVHKEALRLAANEAALRGNVNAMFVNLSRRSQSLVERQIRLIDSLEQGEQDSKRLASLFQMDHLATRMRRNSENLLVLAGQDLSRRWNRPVALVDVLRAALSEIERYERVTLNVQPGIAVRAQAVSDVVHLTAELVENATSFSAADSPVTIAGHLLGSGGVLLEIADQGVGMDADEMAHANWRLDNPPVVDVAVSRRMGLFVVARLAARHGIRVRLRPADAGGLVALVWLPDEAITREGVGTGGMPRRRPIEPENSGPWPVMDGAGPATGDGGRSTVEHEVNVARAPRFAPLRADGDMANSGPLPLTGPISRPGSTWATNTGPLPPFKDSSPPAAESETDLGTPPDGTLGVGSLDASQPLSSPTAPGSLSSPGSNGPLGPPDISGPFGPPNVSGPFSPPDTSGPFSSPDISGPFSSPDISGPFSSPDISGPFSSPDISGPFSSPNVSGPLSSPLDPPSSPPRSPSGVIVPPAADAEEQNRLPIFEAVESDWFRRVRRVVSTPGLAQETGSGSWASPADEGWQAAEVVHAPSSAGMTSAGLPKRVPKANLVPGTAASPAVGQAAQAAASARSAAATRDRFASYQRGVLRGRAAASGTGSDGGEDKTSDGA
jgi:signal transduction histidine kinase